MYQIWFRGPVADIMRYAKFCYSWFRSFDSVGVRVRHLPWSPLTQPVMINLMSLVIVIHRRTIKHDLTGSVKLRPLTGRAQHYVTVLPAEYHSIEISARIWRSTVVIDFVRWICCIFIDNETVYSTWNDLQRSLEVINNGTVQWTAYHFLFVVCSNHMSILYRFWDIQRECGVPLKSQLGVTHPANLCMICTSLKSTEPDLSSCCW